MKYFFYSYILIMLFVGYKLRTDYYPQLLTEIKKQAQQKFQMELDFSSIQLQSLTPIGIRISNINATKQGLFTLDAESLDLEVHNLFDLLQKKSSSPIIHIKMKDFDISLESNPTPPTQSQSQNKSTGSLPFNSLEKALPVNPYINDVSLNIELQNGVFNIRLLS